MPTTVYVFRHGESASNSEKDRVLLFPTFVKEIRSTLGQKAALSFTALVDRCRGKRLYSAKSEHEVKLTSLGEEQSYHSGVALADKGIHPDLILCSPLQRAQKTAEKMCEGYKDKTGNMVEITTLDFLTERDVGDIFGIPISYLPILYPESSQAFKALGTYQFRAPNGESIIDVREKLKNLLPDELGCYEGTVLVIAHKIVNVAIKSILSGTPIEKTPVRSPNLGVSKYNGVKGGWSADPVFDGSASLDKMISLTY
jgi:broad specificity phosphatase PhoE